MWVVLEENCVNFVHFYILEGLVWMFYGCIVRAITSVCAKDFIYFTQKNLLFLFYIITFTKHPHQFIYYTHFFIKIIFFLNFFIISHPPSPNPSFSSEYTPFFFAPSLSLSSPLFFLLFYLFI